MRVLCRPPPRGIEGGGVNDYRGCEEMETGTTTKTRRVQENTMLVVDQLRSHAGKLESHCGQESADCI